MSFIDNAIFGKIASYLLARLTEPNTVLSWIFGIESSFHISKVPPGFNQALAYGVVWLIVAAVSFLPQNWRGDIKEPVSPSK